MHIQVRSIIIIQIYKVTFIHTLFCSSTRNVKKQTIEIRIIFTFYLISASGKEKARKMYTIYEKYVETKIRKQKNIQKHKPKPQCFYFLNPFLLFPFDFRWLGKGYEIMGCE